MIKLEWESRTGEVVCREISDKMVKRIIHLLEVDNAKGPVESVTEELVASTVLDLTAALNKNEDEEL